MIRVAAAVVLAGACATPTPSPGPVESAGISLPPAPTRIETVGPTAAPLPSVVVGDWSAKCERVEPSDCEGVALLFVNNLARGWQAVFDQSGGVLTVAARADCPAAPDWAVPDVCWQATAVMTDGPICMVVARQLQPAEIGFGQVGGDDMSGRLGGPPVEWPRCI